MWVSILIFHLGCWAEQTRLVIAGSGFGCEMYLVDVKLVCLISNSVLPSCAKERTFLGLHQVASVSHSIQCFLTCVSVHRKFSYQHLCWTVGCTASDGAVIYWENFSTIREAPDCRLLMFPQKTSSYFVFHVALAVIAVTYTVTIHKRYNKLNQTTVKMANTKIINTADINGNKRYSDNITIIWN